MNMDLGCLSSECTIVVRPRVGRGECCVDQRGVDVIWTLELLKSCLLLNFKPDFKAPYQGPHLMGLSTSKQYSDRHSLYLNDTCVQTVGDLYHLWWGRDKPQAMLPAPFSTGSKSRNRPYRRRCGWYIHCGMPVQEDLHYKWAGRLYWLDTKRRTYMKRHDQCQGSEAQWFRLGPPDVFSLMYEVEKFDRKCEAVLAPQWSVIAKAEWTMSKYQTMYN